jgi:hypothetical protein
MLSAAELAIMRAEQEAEMTLTMTVKRASPQDNALGTWSDNLQTAGVYKCRVATNRPQPYDAGGRLAWVSNPQITTEWNADIRPGDILEISDGRVFTAIGPTNKTDNDMLAQQIACEDVYECGSAH